MNQEASDPKFRQLLLTLQAYYAHLKCGRYVMKEVFLWLQRNPPRQDIPNVEHFLKNEHGMSNAQYRKYFTATTRDIFQNSGISKVDITALFRMHQTVYDFFKDTEQPWTQLEYILTKIKQDRNDIMHTLLMEQRIKTVDELSTFLESIRDDINTLLQAFQNQYDGYASDQQIMTVKTFVSDTIDEVMKQINVSNLDIQHHGSGSINVRQSVTTDGAVGDDEPEDVLTDLFQQIFSVAGQRGSLSIQHHGTGNINITQEVYHISGGEHTFNI